ncbi:glycopeptide antibiotics resistance protein [Agromyces terreus]|uniref:Glycopeptide antibiotics resistance protein n=1 Tax=Agromyces terreus TaxID=424795 RepID=A0A9X2KDY6_9MICO|nr:VanZ family protein [Agromyces terreus]MCP2370062.1 glycopeptide antibiotics resistance protein [Agromyces terreus]
MHVALVLVILVVLAIGFWPSRVDAGAHDELEALFAWFASIGLPGIDYRVLESAANVVMFVPIGFLVALELGPARWLPSVLVGAALSIVIEAGQWLLLPDRVPSAGDVIANTAGAALGVGLGVVIAGVRRRRSRRRADATQDPDAEPIRPA